MAKVDKLFSTIFGNLGKRPVVTFGAPASGTGRWKCNRFEPCRRPAFRLLQKSLFGIIQMTNKGIKMAGRRGGTAGAGTFAIHAGGAAATP
jgi:hypothetical protein